MHKNTVRKNYFQEQ